MKKLDKLLQYGISSDLAEKAIKNGLSVSKCRSVSQVDMVERYNMSSDEAKYLAKSVKRSPINIDVLYSLVERSNAVCCVCKGEKGTSFIMHHIIPYEKSQDNSYSNLILLCPNDHDMAHQSGLTMQHDKKFLRHSKHKWEKQVETTNEARASKSIEVESTGIDYLNINRIEELCINLFGNIPETSLTSRLQHANILNEYGSFDQRYVTENLSGKKYMFDFITHGETQHYKYLMQHIARKVDFLSLKEHLLIRKLRQEKIQGKYAFFVGGVYSKSPDIPIDDSTSLVLMYYSKSKIRIEWILDPSFIMSMSAIGRLGGKNKYLIYCLVGSITQNEDSTWLIKCSPLMICLPSVSTNNVPDIAYIMMGRDFEEKGLL